MADLNGTDGIALVGMACRLPKANSPAQAWNLIVSGQHVIDRAPEARWVTHRRIAEQKNAKVQSLPKWGGYLDDIDRFDARFFGISTREARLIDPQQRLLLQTSWQALEALGVDPMDFKGSRTGVFVGISTSDYLQRQLLDTDMLDVDAYSGLGSAQSIAANRISHFFDLKGPSLAVDTACSSASVALHLARISLERGECDYAIVGGVNAIISPLSTISFSKARMLAPDGRCKSFDNRANGYVRSEGCVAAVLTRADLARETGRTIHALIKGSAVNQDGRTLSITTPSPQAQEDVIKDALDSAGFTPDDIDFVETHGTGTKVGDAIELEALHQVFAGSDSRNAPVYIGAAKPHFGHLEAASGLLGLLKAVYSLKTRSVPKLAFLEDPVATADERVTKLALETKDFATSHRPLRAAASCFGFGGTNASIVIEEAPQIMPQPARPRRSGGAASPKVLPVSSHHPEPFAGTVSDYLKLVDENPGLDLDEFCAAASSSRAAHPFRGAVIFDGRDDLKRQLEDLLNRPPSAPERAQVGPVAFCFSGQGVQFAGMCARLYAQNPDFAAVLDACDSLTKAQAGFSILDTILDKKTGARARLDDTQFAQPAIFATSLALAKTWEAMGVVPDLVLGHSLGEITAACFAGVMDLPSAMRLVLARGRLMSAAPGEGAMLALTGDEVKLQDFLATVLTGDTKLEVSGRNTAQSITLSGPVSQIKEAAKRAIDHGIKTDLLPVSHAFHSSLMEPILDPFRSAIENIDFQAPRIPIISNLNGALIGENMMNAAYWVRQIRAPVEFQSCVQTLQDAQVKTIVEMGAKPILGAWLHKLNTSARPYAVIPALKSRRDDQSGLLNGLAEAYINGAPVNWKALQPDPAGNQTIDLPPYRFARERFWFENKKTEAGVAESGSGGTGGPEAAGTVSFDLSGPEVRALLSQHIVHGRAVIPGALYIELLARAAEILGTGPGFELAQCELHEMLPLSEVKDARLIVTSLALGDGKWDLALAVNKRNAAEKTIVASARLLAGQAAPDRTMPPEPDGLKAVNPADLYAALEDAGLNYGPDFQAVTRLKAGQGRASATLTASDGFALGRTVLNPCQMDAGFQTAAAALTSLGTVTGGLWVPTGFDRLVVHKALPAVAQSFAQLVDGPHFPDRKAFDLVFYDQNGAICAELRGFRIQRIGQSGRTQNSLGPLFDLSERLLPETTKTAEGWNKGWLVCNLTQSDLAQRIAPYLQEPAITGQASRALVLVDLDAPTDKPGILAQSAVDLFKGLEQAAATGLTRVIVLYLSRRDRTIEADITLAALRAATRVMRNENPKLKATNLLVETPPGADADLGTVLRAALARDEEADLLWRDKGLYALRLAPVTAETSAWMPSQPEAAERRLSAGKKAGIANLITQPFAAPECGDDDVIIAPLAAGLNFRDVLKSLRLYPNRPGFALWLGDECVGRVCAVGRNIQRLGVGDRVMAVAPGMFSTLVRAPQSAVVKAPHGLSDEEAATIPIAFTTAWYALVDLARLKPGETVLIHAAAGGVGLAAINIALDRQARILATAGSDKKRDFLRDIGVEVVGSSRDLDFTETVLQTTNGAGVDVVLNSLAGDALEASIGLLRPFGRFVDIGKRDIVENRPLGLRPFHKSISFHSLDMELLFGAAPQHAQALFQDVADAFDEGRLSPLPRNVFALDSAADAFQYMAAAKNIGKVVLAIQQPKARRAVSASPTPSALVTGAFGDIGLGLVEHLFGAGISGFVLTGRSPPGPDANSVLDKLRDKGAQVLVVSADASDEAAMAEALSDAKAAGLEIRHVFHAAGVLADGMIADIDGAAIQSAWAPKVTGARILDRLTRAPEVESFVCLSSIATILGSPGQVAYAMANAGVDAVCSQRAKAGFAAVSVRFGPWATGMAQQNAETIERFERLGLRTFSLADGLRVLDMALNSGAPCIVAARFAARTGKGPAPAISNLSVCRDLYPEEAGGNGQTSAASSAILQKLGQTEPTDRPEVFVTYLAQKLASVMALAPEDIESRKPLADSGFDSLAGLEFGMIVEEDTGAQFPMDAIGDTTSLADLALLLLADINPDRDQGTEAQTQMEPGDAPEKVPATLPDHDPHRDHGFAGPADAPALGYAPSVPDYIKHVRPDFTRLLPVLDLDRNYTSASGNILIAETDGQTTEVLDFVGGYGSNLFGHNHPRIVSAATRILAENRPVQAQGSARGLSGTLARQLSDALGAETGDEYAVALANSGAEAVEGALKHAVLEYQYRLGKHGIDILSAQTPDQFAPAFLAIEGSYHGKTLGAISIGHFKYWKNAPFGMRVRRVPRNDTAALEKILREERVEILGKPVSTIAGLFVEPVQGEGGVHSLDTRFLGALRQAANENEFPLVFDEIQSGFYRCGSLAASSRSSVTGDYYTFGKSLGGGIAKISALLIRKDRYRPGFGVLQSSTFAEDDFSAQTALAALDLARSEDIGKLVLTRGDYLRNKLEELAQAFPGVIREVRGQGLMFGLEFSKGPDLPSGLLSSARDHDLLGQIICSVLLARHNIRVATPLSAPFTLRLQPSAYVSEAQIDRLYAALHAVCTALERKDGAYLASHLLAKDQWLSDSVECHAPAVRAPSEQARPGVRKVGFLIHMTDDDDLLRWDPSWSRLTADGRQALNQRFAPISQVNAERIALIETPDGEQVEIHFKSLFATTKTIEQAMRHGEIQWLLDQIQTAVDGFAASGCLAVGLGGFLSIVTQNGKRIDDRKIGVTTGNALTVAAGIEGLKKSISTHLQGQEARIGIVGANGNIGQTYARKIARDFSQVTLIGRKGSNGRLTKLARDLQPADATSKHGISISDDLATLKTCNVIVTATNSPSPIIFPEHLGKGTLVLLDISVPADVSPEIASNRQDAHVVPGALVTLPASSNLWLDNFGLPEQQIFGCMAETALLGLEGRNESFSRGDIGLERVEEMLALANKHGFGLS